MLIDTNNTICGVTRNGLSSGLEVLLSYSLTQVSLSRYLYLTVLRFIFKHSISCRSLSQNRRSLNRYCKEAKVVP